MINYSIDIVLPMVDDDYEDEISRVAIEAVGNAIVRYIEAAAEAVPVWTGYSRAVWEGITARIDEIIGLPRQPNISIDAARPWFMPRWPVSNPSTSIAESVEDQYARGFDDGYNAVVIAVTKDSIYLNIEIPEYFGEENYAIKEDEWKSLIYGGLAFNEAMAKFRIDLKNVLLFEQRIRG